jgi:hypothetical protein
MSLQDNWCNQDAIASRLTIRKGREEEDKVKIADWWLYQGSSWPHCEMHIIHPTSFITSHIIFFRWKSAMQDLCSRLMQSSFNAHSSLNSNNNWYPNFPRLNAMLHSLMTRYRCIQGYTTLSLRFLSAYQSKQIHMAKISTMTLPTVKQDRRWGRDGASSTSYLESHAIVALLQSLAMHPYPLGVYTTGLWLRSHCRVITSFVVRLWNKGAQNAFLMSTCAVTVEFEQDLLDVMSFHVWGKISLALVQVQELGR